MMAVCAKLESILDESELSEISENVKIKINEAFERHTQVLENVKSENSELKAVSERQQFQFEKEIFENQERLKESSEQSLKFKNQVIELEGKLSSLQKQWRELQSTHDTNYLELQSTKKGNELLCQEKKDLADQLEKTRNDISKQNTELKNLLDQITSANEAKYEAIAAAEGAKMKESNFQHKVKRLDQERELLMKQINDLNTELSQKNHEIYSLKREKSSGVLDLQLQLENRVDEIHILQKQSSEMKKSIEEKDRRIEALAERIRGMNQSTSENEEQYQLELRAQTKLTDLYKQSSEEAQQRVQELVRGFKELQEVLKESKQAYIDLENHKVEMENNFKFQLETKLKESESLKEELKNANDLLPQSKKMTTEKLEAMFPSAAAASKVLHSGMTLTQLYTEYIKSQEEIQREKNENLRLTQQLKQIVSEIEENTPVINQRMTEYHKAIETISCLRTQLACSLTDQECLQAARDDAKRISGQMERENGRLRLQTADLSRQVQVLLKEIEEARGGFVHSANIKTGDPEVSSTDQLNASKVITEHLVTFRSIEELQNKNQQLLCVVRELSEQQEEQEKKITEEKTLELRTQLDKAMKQLEDLQKSRVKQAEMVETIIRQRDMYRVLLSNQGFHESLLGTPLSSSTPFSKGKVPLSPGDSRLQETRTALKQLQLDFDNYKKEKAENTKMLNEQVEKLRDGASDLRIQNAKLSSQLEYSEERFNLLQTNMENYKRENTSVREKNQKHTAMITQHQQTINTLRQDIMVAHEKLAKAEVAVENLRAERELLKGMEVRLMQEKESILREQQQQTRLVANLQTVQNNLERIESETQRSLKYQIEKYDKENGLLKVKLDNASDEYKAAVKVWERQVKEMQQKLDKEIERNRKTHEDLVDAYATIHKLKQEASQIKSKAVVAGSQSEKKAESTNRSIQSAQLPAEIKNLKEQINESQNKIKALQEQLELAENSSSNYHSMATEWELRVKEQDEINKQLKEEMEKALESSATAKTALEQNLEEMEKTNRQLIEENMKLTQDRNSKFEDIQKEINSLKKQLEVAESMKEEAEKVAAKARGDCQVQQKMMQEAQSKYERELSLHANDVEQLIAVKEEHQLCHNKMELLSQKESASQQALVENMTAWKERETLLMSEREALKQRSEQLEQQNEHALNQLELMGTKMASLQGKKWDESLTSAETDTKDTQHLMQVIQFIRKEKEIATTQYDAAQSENLRLKMKVEQLVLQLSQLKSDLAELQENSQAKAFSDSQHAEILQKIEMMNLLTDSNRLLRSEKEALSEKTKLLEIKLEELVARVSPLQAENKEMLSQIDVYSSENAVLRTEIKSWQSRTNQLLEQSHKIGPQEYKNLMKEIEELRRQKGMLADELQKKQTEALQMNNSISQHKKENDSLRNEIIESQKTVLQVKKIGRKYKTSYDELKASYDELVKNSSAPDSASREEALQEMQKKVQEMEQEVKTLTEELDKQKDFVTQAKRDTEIAQNEAMSKDERAKKLMAQVKQKYSQLSNQKEVLTNENNSKSKEIDVMKIQISELRQASEESNLRAETLKSQLDSKIASLEKDLKASKEMIEYLEKRSEELNQKVAHQQKQASKSTTAGGLTDRGSGGSSEPLTANIKPLAPPAQTSGSNATLRHTVHSHVTAAISARSTPTASIRPMAIGTVASSTAPQTRMAAVLPTTVAPVPVSAEEDLLPTQTQPLSVPQATVQPTPATATVTVGRTTVAATVAPSSHPLVISEVAPSTGISSVVESAVEAVPAQVESVQSHHISGSSMTTPATALVSPRIEGSDGSGDGLPIDTPAPTTSVIVSPPATQTQVVTPTVKRQREFDAQSPTECGDGSVSLQKRVRMISEGSQTNQQLPSSSTTVSNIAVVPAASVVGRKISPEVSTSEAELQPMIECQPSTSSAKSAILEETSKSPMEKDIEDGLETEGAQLLEWESQESIRGEEIEGMEDDVQSDSFEDEERMQGVTYPSRPMEDEDMADDTVDNTEEMQPSDCIETIGDSSSNDQMDADSNSIQTPQDDQCMAPPPHPTSLGTSTRSDAVSPSTSTEAVLSHGSPGLSQRLPHLPRVPSRQDRLPSVGRQQHLTFTIPGQSSVFEEGDDSIVPSTPTLFVPKRTDGFAEAVSSPHVPQGGRFVFSSTEGGSPSQQGPSQLASQAVGVDDTRMDLSQFDEGGARTVPSNPLQVSPPADSVCPEVPEIIIEQPSSPNSTSSVSDTPVIPIKVQSEDSPGLKLHVYSKASKSPDPMEKSTSYDKEVSAVIETPSQESSTKKPEEEIKVQKEPQSVITSVTSEAGLPESSVKSASPSQPGTDTKSKDFQEAGAGDEIQSAPSLSANQTGQRRPIVWTERGKPHGVPPQSMQFPTPSSHPTASVRASRTQRGRRTRFRAAGAMYARGPPWGGSLRRSRGPRGGHMF